MRNGNFGAQSPSTINFKDHLLIDEVIEKRRNEQRLPLGAPKQRLGEGQSQLFVLEPQREIALDLGTGQSIEPQFAAAAMNLKVLMQSPNRMSSDNGIGWAI